MQVICGLRLLETIRHTRFQQNPQSEILSHASEGEARWTRRFAVSLPEKSWNRRRSLPAVDFPVEQGGPGASPPLSLSQGFPLCAVGKLPAKFTPQQRDMDFSLAPRGSAATGAMGSHSFRIFPLAPRGGGTPPRKSWIECAPARNGCNSRKKCQSAKKSLFLQKNHIFPFAFVNNPKYNTSSHQFHTTKQKGVGR